MELSGHAWSALYAIFGSILGGLLLVGWAFWIPKILNRFTRQIDEEKEMLRGNVAVAHYFGMIVAALILGLSGIISVAIYVALK
jgi:membrane protein YqaA with SNARE-associated domain